MKLLVLVCGLIAATQGIAAPRFAPSGLLCDLLAYPERSVITNPRPDFGWIVNSPRAGDSQKAWQIMVASRPELLRAGKPDLWDSGVVRSGDSINVPYAGKALAPNSSYWWKVRTWNNLAGASDWSSPQKFNLGDLAYARNWPAESRWIQLTNEQGIASWTFENRHPLIYHPVQPVNKSSREGGIHFFDFGRAAFSTLDMDLGWQPKAGENQETNITVHVGEKAIGNAIDRKPGGGVVFRSFPLKIRAGAHSYTLEFPRFVPRYPHSQPMPPQLPEVAPFRFVEVVAGPLSLEVNRITQRALYYTFNPDAASFSCSDKRLNDIYELCKYSTIANTFNGDYANSERERMMYEADCYIQQLCHYAVDREFAIARYSTENLFYHATWPTEWISHSVLMAHADYRHTGNKRSLRAHYPALRAKTMTALEMPNDLISTRTGLQTPEFRASIHFNGKELRDIVDWPHAGMGLRETGGETDNFDFREFNTVVNAFYYRGLVCMAELAEAAGETADAAFFRQKAEKSPRRIQSSVL
jgi:alpha-L-rhamnosidase